MRCFVSTPRQAGLSALGTAAWTLVLACAGRLLGSRFQQVEQWIGPVSSAIVAGAVLWYFYRVLRMVRSRPVREAGESRTST